MVKFLGLYDAIFTFFTVRTWGKARVTEIPGGAPPPQTPPGGKAWVTEIPEGGFAPPDPPTTPFQKKKTSASTVVHATFGRKIFWPKKISAEKFAVRIAEGGNDGGGQNSLSTKVLKY